jgi:hypothetical protein
MCAKSSENTREYFTLVAKDGSITKDLIMNPILVNKDGWSRMRTRMKAIASSIARTQTHAAMNLKRISNQLAKPLPRLDPITRPPLMLAQRGLDDLRKRPRALIQRRLGPYFGELGFEVGDTVCCLEEVLFM